MDVGDIVSTLGEVADATWVYENWALKLVMNWQSSVAAAAVVAFPLMYRTARGAFESFDVTLRYSAQTLGLSNTYIFWRILMPYCKQGIIAGLVLAFARGLGEYGATSMVSGYTPGKLWCLNDNHGAFVWVMINLAISAVVLLAVNLFEKRDKETRAKAASVGVRG